MEEHCHADIEALRIRLDKELDQLQVNHGKVGVLMVLTFFFMAQTVFLRVSVDFISYYV